MRYGTKEELEAAKDDATLLPFDALFKTASSIGNPCDYELGLLVKRVSGSDFSDKHSVKFEQIDGEVYNDFWYVDAKDLEAINV